MRKIIGALAVIFIMFSFSGQASANNGSLYGVHSEAVVNDDGTVDIEQTWTYDDSQVNLGGTEHYINLNASYGPGAVSDGKEAITDYEVYRNGEKMKFESVWDVNRSFDSKSGRYGIIEIGPSELELTFGITEKIMNEFVVKYKVHNIVKETSDGYKYLHWTFVPTELSPNPRNLTAEITTESGMDIDKVYGFKYEGSVGYVNDQRDRVFAEMDGKYGDDTTLNVFTLFNDEGNAISNTTPVDMTLEKKAKQILKGSSYNLKHFNEDHFEEISSSTDPWYKKIFKSEAIMWVIPVGGIIGFMVLVNKFSMSTRLMKNMEKEDKKKLKKSKDFYYRDEPEEIAYSTELVRELIPSKETDNNLISYFISKWTSDGVFEHLGVTEPDKVLFFKPTPIITFKLNQSKINIESKLEEELLEEFYRIADYNDVISTRDLTSLKMSTITSSIRKHKSASYSKLKEAGYVNNSQALTKTGEDLIFQHAGLKNFLTAFTLLNERSSSEIELWDYYFHMAALYGIADEFKKELGNMPNLSDNEREKYNTHYGSASSAILTRSISNAVNSAYKSHNTSKSSSGGGGGSSGGGSGGGTR